MKKPIAILLVLLSFLSGYGQFDYDDENLYFNNSDYRSTKKYSDIHHKIVKKESKDYKVDGSSNEDIYSSLNRKYKEIASKRNERFFVENKGQIQQSNGLPAPYISFVFESGNTSIFLLRKGGMAFQFKNRQLSKGNIDYLSKGSLIDENLNKINDVHKEFKTETFRMDMYLEGANINAEILAEEPIQSYEHYYAYNAFFVRQYRKVIYKDIYPGIDWIIYATDDGYIKYEFDVNPGADPKLIKLKFTHHELLEIDTNGNLIHANRLGYFIEKAPVSYQNGKIIKTHFVLLNNILSFDIENYSHNLKFTIDPARQWGTYYGDTIGAETGYGCATDLKGNVYMVGSTSSPTSIASLGHQDSIGGNPDAYIVKFNKAGVRLWASYYGGSNEDYGYSCDTDNNGNVYLSGMTLSLNNIASGGHQNTYGGGAGGDGFLVKFDSSGVRQWGTFYGGSAEDYGWDCATDKSGNVFLAGRTYSTNNISSSGHQNVFGGIVDAFLVKFNAAGVRQWGTYYGGTTSDEGYTCATDSAGNAFLAGSTSSSTNIASGGHQNVRGIGYSAFLVKFNGSGVRQWATYYGAHPSSYGMGCATDKMGNVFLAGVTSDTSSISSGGHQNNYMGGTRDGFLVKFSPMGVRQWGSYYGGSGFEDLYSCATDTNGNVYIAGLTRSSNNIASGGYLNTFNGVDNDAFIVKFNNNGIRQWGSYYGGASIDQGNGCAADNFGNVYMVGATFSNSGIASGGHQNIYSGYADAFLVKFGSCNISNGYISLMSCNSYLWPTTGLTYTASGTYTDTLINQLGCDSVVTLTLTIHNTQFSLDTHNVCDYFISPSGSYLWTTTGIYTDTLTSQMGCDSIVTISLIVRNSSYDTIFPVACYSYISPGGSYTWSSSGVYTDTLTNATGCDSVLTIYLTISSPVAVAVQQPACAGDTLHLFGSGGVSYKWFGPLGFADTTSAAVIPNATLARSGLYTLVITDAFSCNDTSSLTVVVDTLPVSGIPVTDTICESDLLMISSLVSPGFNYYWNTGETAHQIVVDSAGEYVLALTNSKGCTSLDTFTLYTDTLPYVGFVASIADRCQYDAPQTPAEGWPTGGVYSGAILDTSGRIKTQNFGIFPLRYAFTDANGCSAHADTLVRVRKRPTVGLSNFGNFCENIAADTINTHSPKGGIFFGISGIVNDSLGIVNPRSMGAGVRTIQYAYFDGFCRDTVFRAFAVKDTTPLGFSNSISICANAAPIILGQADSVPGGQFGVYSGNGVVGGNIFKPLLASPGIQIINYRFTNTQGCTSHTTRQLDMDTLPILSLNQPNVCENTPSFALNGGLPVGGSYFGRGVSADSLFPAVAGNGLDTVYYFYTDGNGCTDTASRIFTVLTVPNVQLILPDSVSELCAFGDPVFLSGNSPVGGQFSGPHLGATRKRFFPDTAGVFAVTYAYTAANSCSDSVSDFIVIHALPTVRLSYADSLSNGGLCVNKIPHPLFGGIPAGGFYSGFGVDASGVFRPLVAGAQNNYRLVYTFKDTNGCAAHDTNFFRVDSLTPVNLGLIPDFCLNGGTDTLRQGSLFAGGKYLGRGVVSDSIYNPLLAGLGTDTLFYVHTNLRGCSDTLSQTIDVYAAPVVQMNLPVSHSEICINESAFALNFATPTGGSYMANSGISSGLFAPVLAGIGTHLITYNYTDANNCTSRDSASVLVRGLPSVSFVPDTFCINQPAQHLRVGVPAGGRYLGPGMITDSLFNPLLAGTGNKTLTYTYTDIFGCYATTSGQIRVNNKPLVSFNPLAPVCANRDTFALQGAATTGIASWFKGNGIVDSTSGFFLASVANMGSNIIAFIGQNALGCSDTVYRTLRVDSVPVVRLDTLPELCATASPITLNQGMPKIKGIGIYSGVGVVGSTFYPALSGMGNFWITYQYTDFNNCSDTAMRMLKVHANPQVYLSAVPDLCLGTDSFVLTQGTPAGGQYSGMFTDAMTGKFKPDSVGLWGLQYHYTDTHGCSGLAASTIRVRNLPAVALHFNQRFCRNSNSVLLGGGLPLGNAFYRGAGVSGNRYDPQLIGGHTDTLWYVYTDNFGCRDSAGESIAIDSLTPLHINTFPSVCRNSAPLALGLYGLPGGGVFTGLGISSNNFYPSISGEGTFALRYNYTNALGCVSEITDTLRVFGNPNIAITPDTMICPGFSAVLRADGALSYVWGHGDFGPVTTVSPAKTTTYSIAATNVHNCVTTRNIKVSVADKYDVFTTASPSNCGKSTGSGFVSVTGGKAPFTYRWFDGVLSSTHKDLAGGNYVVTISDANGCHQYGNVSVSDRNAPILKTDSIRHIHCHGETSGMIAVSATGAEPLNFLWSTGRNGRVVSSLSEGIYSVAVRDKDGCVSARTFSITGPAAISATSQITAPTCDSANGVIQVAISGGTPGYNLLWSDATSGSVLSAAAGYHELYIQDNKLCRDTLSFVLNHPAAGQIRIDSIHSVHCALNDGAVYLTPIDSITQYRWSNGDTTPVVTGLNTGKYILTTTDRFGCKRSYPINIEPQKPFAPALCAVSVDTSEQQPLIRWDTSNTAGFSTVIFRESGAYGRFVEIARPMAGTADYRDTTAYASRGISKYYVALEDACNQLSPATYSGSNNLLTASRPDSQIIELRWTGISHRPVSKYLVYRYTSEKGIKLLDSVVQPNLYLDYNAPMKQSVLQYFVVARFANGCGNADLALSNLSENLGIIVQGVSNVEEYVHTRVYPNPSDGLVYLVFGKPTDIAQVAIFDLLGNKLKVLSTLQKASDTYMLDLSQFSSGVYLLAPMGNLNEGLLRVVINR